MVFSETNLRKLWDEFNFLPFCSPREAGGEVGVGWTWFMRWERWVSFSTGSPHNLFVYSRLLFYSKCTGSGVLNDQFFK